jgi:uncharacterized protein
LSPKAAVQKQRIKKAACSERMPNAIMPVDHYRYDLLVQDALKGVMRRLLSDVARDGLTGEHHFLIQFRTHAPGVRLSSALRAQYPDQMMIVLQHSFWDLKVTESAFEVGLSFKDVPERLLIPFDAVTAFYDPSVEFGLQFEVKEEEDKPQVAGKGGTASSSKAKPELETGKSKAENANASPLPQHHLTAADTSAQTQQPQHSETTPEPASGNVVTLDAFRKKT